MAEDIQNEIDGREFDVFNESEPSKKGISGVGKFYHLASAPIEAATDVIECFIGSICLSVHSTRNAEALKSVNVSCGNKDMLSGNSARVYPESTN